MFVTCKNKRLLQKVHACWGIDFDNNIFEVYAIAKFSNTNEYLLVFKNDRPMWYRSNLFEIIDTSVSTKWITKIFPLFSKLKNSKYDFSIPIKFYNGPPEFLENKDFLFNIYEDSACAFNFLNAVVINKKKYNKN